ncbi:MAG TPA: N-acetylmuramoyl-L-alanine amidase, partial [Acidobacteriota bacterium]|nr:N-acetylmuramoyl-L-alanine amidase [Acidobacteriota bacterium]
AAGPAPPKAAPPEKKAAPPTLLPSVVPEKRVIVLDPGHGGTETGAKGSEGAFEKDIVMGIARRLKSILESGTGARVILTRDGDKSVTLDDRTALANNNKADLFISIHANATIRGYAKGAETYFLSSQASDDESRNIAALENNAIGLNETAAVDEDLQLILWDMAQTEYLTESSQLAEMIQQELNEALGISNRGIKQAPFRVLMGAMMPAVLIEVGFINNPAEERLMKSADYQTKIATAIYRSIQRFQSARIEQSSQPKSSGR